MKYMIINACFFYAFFINAERPFLTVEELERESDKICTGRISAIYQKHECVNPSCTNIRIQGEIDLNRLSCSNSTDSNTKARFYKEIYTDDFGPPGAYGHNPQPVLGQTGILYIKAGEIVYPNGWLVTSF